MVLSGVRHNEGIVSISAAGEFSTTLFAIRPQATESCKPVSPPQDVDKPQGTSAATIQTATADTHSDAFERLLGVLGDMNERIARMEETFSSRLESLELAVQRHSGLLEQLARTPQKYGGR